MLQAILVSIVAFLAAIDEYTFGASMMGRPLFTAPIVGLILGDFQAGIMIGATLELMFMGSIMVGRYTAGGVCLQRAGNSHCHPKRGGSGDSRCTGTASVHIPADVEKRLLRHRRQLGR